jgi:AraC-like DNA-binding protein
MALRFKNMTKKAVSTSYVEPLRDFYLNTITPGQKDPEFIKSLSTKKRYLTWEEYQAIFDTLIFKLSCPDFAFDVLEESQISHHGALGLAVLCGFNLRQALNIVLNFYRIRSQLFKLTVFETADDKISIEFDLQFPLNRVMQSTLELAMGTIHKSKKEIIDLANSGDAIYFSFPEPDYIERYRDFFDCPVYFNQAINRFVFPKEQLKAKLRFVNQEAREALLSQCEQDLSHIDSEQDIVQHVKAFLQSCDSFPSLDTMATQLHVSSRSLRRHLQFNHTSYQQLLTDERIRRAKILLIESTLSITNIALKLGYSESANFSKAFKKIAKMSPATYRKNNSN